MTTSPINTDDLQTLLGRARGQAAADRTTPVGLTGLLVYRRVADAGDIARPRGPGIELVPDQDDRPWLQITRRILQQGDRYRRAAPDGSPLIIINEQGAWQFGYAGDFGHVTTDPQPMPYRRRSANQYWAFLLPPTLPQTYRPTSEGVFFEHDDQAAWKFPVVDRAEFGERSRWTVAVDQRTGQLVRFAFDGTAFDGTAESGDMWEWQNVQRGVDIDPGTFIWTGPDRSIYEAMERRTITSLP